MLFIRIRTIRPPLEINVMSFCIIIEAVFTDGRETNPIGTNGQIRRNNKRE